MQTLARLLPKIRVWLDSIRLQSSSLSVMKYVCWFDCFSHFFQSISANTNLIIRMKWRRAVGWNYLYIHSQLSCFSFTFVNVLRREVWSHFCWLTILFSYSICVYVISFLFFWRRGLWTWHSWMCLLNIRILSKPWPMSFNTCSFTYCSSQRLLFNRSLLTHELVT